jgi:hypothetical protein
LRRRIHHDELRRGLLAVVFWLSFYIFERSLAKTVGLAGTLLVYLAVPALLLDNYLNRFDQVVPEEQEPESEEDSEREAMLRAWHSR